jgi:hypothetical protein
MVARYTVPLVATNRKRRRRVHLLRPIKLMQDRCDRRRWWRRRFRRLVRVAWSWWITLVHAVPRSGERPKTIQIPGVVVIVVMVVVTVLVRGRGKAHAVIEFCRTPRFCPPKLVRATTGRDSYVFRSPLRTSARCAIKCEGTETYGNKSYRHSVHLFFFLVCISMSCYAHVIEHAPCQSAQVVLRRRSACARSITGTASESRSGRHPARTGAEADAEVRRRCGLPGGRAD